MSTTHHVNHVVLVGRVLQTWQFENDRCARLQMHRPVFVPSRADGPSDLVNVVLPEAVARGQMVKEGDELHVEGFLRNADRDVLLSNLLKQEDLPAKWQKTRVKQIVTEVVATNWQIVPCK
jgi:hypothetical protein